MKVAFVITRSDTIGGAAIHVRDLSIALGQAGHRVRVFVGGEGMYLGHLTRCGVDAVSVPSLVQQVWPGRDLQAMRDLSKHFKVFRPDLVSTHSSKAGWLGRVVAYRLDIPVLFTAHGWAFTAGVPQPMRTAYGVAEAIASRFATIIVTVSEFDRQLALRWKVAPANRMVTVHNGVPDIPAGALADPRGIRGTPPTIVMIARLDAQKDHPTLFHALSTLTDRPFQVVLIGDGPHEGELRKMAADLRIGSRVTFLGFQDDVSIHLANAHIFTLVSHWEGFPRSVLEAMRARLPVVASQVGGVPESVRDGQTGFLCPHGDVETLRDRLARLLDDPALRHRMGQAGRSLYLARFTLDRLVRDNIRLYRSMVQKDESNSA